MTRKRVISAACANREDIVDCACDPGADGMVRGCGPTPRGSNLPPRSCTLDLFCFNGSNCDDATVGRTCVPR